MPKISVIMCAYNAGRFIERAAESCLGQTFSDTELIIVNDGSTDNTYAVCSRLAMCDRRVKVINTSNSGPAAARNTGLGAAKGEFAAFCDADDFIDPDALETMYDTALHDGSDMVICGYHRDIFKNGRLVGADEIKAGTAVFKTREELLDKFIDLKSTFILDSSCNKLLRRGIISENGLKMPKGELFEDTSFILGFLSISCKVSLVDRCFYHYIRRENGSLTSSYNRNKIRDLKRLYGELADFTDGAKNGAREYCSMFFLRTAYSCLSELYQKPAAGKTEIRRTIKETVNDKTFVSAAESAAAGCFSDRVTLFAARSGSAAVSRLYCFMLYFLKNRARRIFEKLKR